MITYKIKDTITEGKTDMELTIVKSGADIEFTPAKIAEDVIYLKKSRKEVSAQSAISAATMENVKKSHPHIASMSNEDLTAAYLYREAMGVVTVASEKINEIDSQLDEYAKDIEEIVNQTGIKYEELELPSNPKKDEEVKNS